MRYIHSMIYMVMPCMLIIAPTVTFFCAYSDARVSANNDMQHTLFIIPNNTQP